MLTRIKQLYWTGALTAARWGEALSSENRAFLRILLKQGLTPPKSLHRVDGETAARASAALEWIRLAYRQGSDDGVSYGYFPVAPAKGWEVSYPETTGYIITTLVRYGVQSGHPVLLDEALRMAQWEAQVQMASGAVQGGKLTSTREQSAASFNTGMVLDGFVSVLEHKSDETVEQAARRAGNFLVSDLDENGLFKTNGAFVSSDAIKIYNVLCAWALCRLSNLDGQLQYKNAALMSVEGALRHQQANGWFANNCLSDRFQPLTHTIGYVAQGILEVGVLCGRSDFIRAVETCIDGMEPHVQENGFLSGRFDSGWHPRSKWVCLTGSAQIAIVALRLYELGGSEKYLHMSKRLLGFLKAVQTMDSGNPGIDGALAGSYPVTGEYMAWGYPNWATKYFLDALIQQAGYENIQLLAPEKV